MNYILLISFILISFPIFGQDSTHYAKGVAFASKGDYKKAKEEFSKETEKTPLNYYAWFNLALTESYLYENKKSIEHFGKAIQLKSDYYKAYLNRALVKRDITLYSSALEDLNKALEIKSDYGRAHYHKAILLEYLNKSKAACSSIAKAIELEVDGAERMAETICLDKRDNNYANITTLDEIAKDTLYGYNEKHPIKVGKGLRGGPANQRAYLNLLRSPNNKPMKYNRRGSCCAYQSKNGLIGGMAMLDMYELSYEENGITKTKLLYISLYDYEKPKIPFGFKTISKIK